MDDAFVGAVIGVGEKWRPSVRKGFHVDSEAVILWRDKTTASVFVRARLIHSTVTYQNNNELLIFTPDYNNKKEKGIATIFHLESGESGSQSQQLMAQTDAKNRFVAGLQDTA